MDVKLAIVRNERQPLQCFEFRLPRENIVLLIVPEHNDIAKLREMFEYCSKVMHERQLVTDEGKGADRNEGKFANAQNAPKAVGKA